MPVDSSGALVPLPGGDMLVGITGASGFIGSALARRHVEAGDAVRCLTRRPHQAPVAGARVVQGDLTTPDDRLTRFADGLDVLYHCAGELHDERRMRLLHVDGTRALLSAAERRIGRWVQMSSTGAYGRRQSGVVTEETPLDPQGPYEVTKAAADALVMHAGRSGLIASFVVVRPSIVFGPSMPNQSVLQMIHMVERGLFFFIGRQGASANYIDVSNVVDALVLCGSSAAADGRVYNVSDWCTVEDFAGAIADALGRPRPRLRLPERAVRTTVQILGRLATLPLTHSRIDALVSRVSYSVDRIRRELDYSLGVSIAAGLARLVAQRGPS